MGKIIELSEWQISWNAKMNKLEKYSHQLKQYVKVKKRHPKMILFYRIDDFYELFSDDAVIVSKILNLTLTSRKGVQMCGVPVHNVSMHLKKMVHPTKAYFVS